ncbi:MAG: hypothetical protein WAQ52_11610 [Terriglobales bacterium]
MWQAAFEDAAYSLAQPRQSATRRQRGLFLAAPPDATESGSNYAAFSVGKVVGELAVQRESLSRAWTGSPEARECILNALIGDIEECPRTPVFPVADRATGYSPEYALL